MSVGEPVQPGKLEVSSPGAGELWLCERRRQVVESAFGIHSHIGERDTGGKSRDSSSIEKGIKALTSVDGAS